MNQGDVMAKIGQKFMAVLRSGPGTRLLLLLFLALVIGVVFVGLTDAPGYILGYLATVVIFILIVRGWRSVWSFVILMVGSFAGGVLLSGLYVEVISRVAVYFWGPGAPVSLPMRIIETIVANIILFAGPVGLVFGFAGALGLGIFRLLRLRTRPLADDT
jgi:hypothetical protein